MFALIQKMFLRSGLSCGLNLGWLCSPIMHHALCESSHGWRAAVTSRLSVSFTKPHYYNKIISSRTEITRCGHTPVYFHAVCCSLMLLAAQTWARALTLSHTALWWAVTVCRCCLWHLPPTSLVHHNPHRQELLNQQKGCSHELALPLTCCLVKYVFLLFLSFTFKFQCLDSSKLFRLRVLTLSYHWLIGGEVA